MAHSFVWYDLITTDPQAAAEFYSAVVGWNITASSIPEHAGYRVVSNESGEIGGMLAIPPEAAAGGVGPCWNGYIYVENVDEIARRVVELDGSVKREPWDIPEAGRFCVIADPLGAVLHVMTPPAAMIADAPRRPSNTTIGNIGWNELRSGEVEPSFRFYEQLFGWHFTDTLDVGDGNTYRMFATAEKTDAAIVATAPGERPGWTYYINVPGIDDALMKIEACGGSVITAPQQVPSGSWILHARDPQHAAFALVAPAR